MLLSDLQRKDVINVSDGRKIGNIIDVKIDENTGNIISMVVEVNKFFSNLFSSKEGYDVYWPQIQKIGEDVILIKTEKF
jgi:YlmC/YmxH family sporulation protein